MSELTPEQFKRLPKDGAQFEALVCQLLEAMGYRILEKPAIGNEGGRDILVERILKDEMVERSEKVVIQCKHHAHSGKAVGDRDVGVWINAMKRYKARGYLLVTDVRVTENLSQSFRAFSNDEAHTPSWASFWDVDELIRYLNRYTAVRDSFFPVPALPKTSLDQLAEEIRIWLTAIRYEVSEPRVSSKKTLDMVASFNQGTIKQEILVRCVGGEISRANVNELNQSLTIKTPQGWLISDRRVSVRAIKQAEDLGTIQVFNLSTLLRQMIWSNYFESLIELVEFEKINERYVDIGCFKIEIDDQGKEIAREKNQSLDRYIDDWLGERGKMHISLLADFGSGKTWFCRHYASMQLQRFLSNPSKERLPVLITLRSFAKAMTAPQLINYMLLEHYKLPFVGSAYEVFQEMNRRGKLLLILDGFDEMARKVDYQTVVDNFWELAKLVEDDGKVILTSRKEYFRQAKESEKVLGGEEYGRETLVLEPPKFEVMYLEPLTNEQIRVVIVQRHGEELGNRAADTILASETLSEMARKPLMVELLLAALDEVSADVLKNEAQVFLYATNRLLLRNIKAEKTFTSTADKLYFLCELAWEMIRSNELRIHYTLVPERIRSYFGDRIKDQHELDTWDYDLRSQTLLHRDSAGYYEFAHKSLAEYFVALKFALELDCLSPLFLETYSELDGSPCTTFIGKKSLPQLLDSFGLLPAKSNLETVLKLLTAVFAEDARQKLWDTIRATRGKTRDQVRYVASNALSILVLIGEDLLGQDLSRLTLPELDLETTSLARTDLTGTVLVDGRFRWVDLSESNCFETNFSKANLINVVMRKTTFTRADFTDTDIAYRRSLLTVAYHPGGNWIAADGPKGEVRLWNVSTGEKVLSLRGHVWLSQCIEFSRRGDLVAAGISDGQLLVADATSGETIWRKRAHGDMVRWLQFSPDDQLLASVGENRKLTIWHATSGKRLTEVKTPEHSVSVAFSPDSQYIAAGTETGTLLVWELSTMTLLWDCSVGNDSVHFIRFSPDSNKLIIGVENYPNPKTTVNAYEDLGEFIIKVWDFNQKRQERQIVSDFLGGWNRGSISSTEPLVVARSGKTVKIWNYDTGEEFRLLPEHAGTVFCMVFSPSGTEIATCGQDGILRICDINSGDAKGCIVLEKIYLGARFIESIGLRDSLVHPLTIGGASIVSPSHQ